MVRLLSFFTLVNLAACQTTKENPVPEGRGVAFFVTSHRHLEMEPCGCAIMPRGGLGREYRFRQKLWKEHGETPLAFAVGSTFAPLTGIFEAAAIKSGQYEHKAEYVLRGLSALGYRGINPSLEDLGLGTATLKRLAKKSGIPLVSSNLLDKSGNYLFQPKLRLTVESNQILVLGLSGSLVSGTAPEGIQVLSPSEAIDRALKDEAAEVVVILSGLRQMVQIEHRAAFLRAHVILGGHRSENTENVNQIGPRTLHINSGDRGREIGYIGFKLNQPIKDFHNLEVAMMNQQTYETWSRSIANMSTELKSKKDAQLTKRRDDLVKYRERLYQLPKQSPAQAVSYRFLSEILNNDYQVLDREKNPLTKIIDAYKESLRERALAGQH